MLQEKIGEEVSVVLSEIVKSRVSVSRIIIGATGRVILDNVRVWDQKDSLMLEAPRIAAKLNLFTTIMRGKISIANGQILGAKIKLYQECPDCNPNFTFLTDAFSSKDSTSTPLDLHIGSLIVRQSALSWDKQWIEKKNYGFDPSHLSLSAINTTTHLYLLTNDSISLRIKRLSAKEDCGLIVKNLILRYAGSLDGGNLNDFHLLLDKSEVKAEGTWSKTQNCNLALTSSVYLSDFAPVVEKLSEYNKPIYLKVDVGGTLDELSIDTLKATTSLYNFNLLTAGTIRNYSNDPDVNLNIQELSCENLPTFPLLGCLKCKGNVRSSKGNHCLNLDLSSSLGDVALQTTLSDAGEISVSAFTEVFDVGQLTEGKLKLGKLAADIVVKSQLPCPLKEGLNVSTLKDNSHTTIEGYIPFLNYDGYTFHNFDFQVERNCKDTRIVASLPDSHGSLEADVNIADDEWTEPTGEIDITGFCYNKEDDELQMEPVDIHLEHRVENNEHQLSLTSNPLKVQASGNFHFAELKSVVLDILKEHLPLIITAETKPFNQNTDLSISMMVKDTLLLRKFCGIELKIPETAHITSNLDNNNRLVFLSAQIPELQYGSNLLRNTRITTEALHGGLAANIYTERIGNKGTTNLTLNTNVANERIRTIFSWDNLVHKNKQSGNIDISTNLQKDSIGNMMANMWFAPSEIIISDTIWRLHPSTVQWHDGKIDIRGFRLSERKRELALNGRISKLATDTLTAHLKDINIEYIMDLVNFHDVLLGGNATGFAYLTQGLSSPLVDSHLQVDNFLFNSVSNGQLDAHLAWGKSPNTLDIEGLISNPKEHNTTHVKGYVSPGNMLDLNIETENFNLAFLNYFTDEILEDVQGRVSGNVRVFGKPRQVNLDGGLRINEASLIVPQTGIKYYIRHNEDLSLDSVVMWPDNIVLKNAILHDDEASVKQSDHLGLVSGHFTHKSFKKFTYDFDIDAHNLLGFRKKSLNGSSYCGTAYITGNVHLFGGPGKLQLDVNATPMKGSSFTYSISGNADAEEAGFITYKSPTAESKSLDTASPDFVIPSSSDVRLNFNLDITQDATLNVLMDSRSGDCIELFGDGHISANYYNKGDFRMYGAYTIDRGSYRLNIQDLLMRNFTFRKGGTVIFNGDPFNAALNLEAAYTIPNVSLNDLSDSNLGMNNTKVDCIMQLTGQARNFNIGFDFDLPNGTEDQKRIVKAMVSTEEEKNMQAIYLLGIGRFYSNSSRMQGTGGQSSTAMYSLVANTLAQQFNRFLSDAVGNNNWSIGANLRTGENGWDNLDVEGMLSGRMLNNRLIFNGNFGYRESNYTTRNIITDVDIQYMLTKNGSVSLKAYNKTNDRYFVQNSFNIQGIGIQLQKDFNRLRDLFKPSGSKMQR